MNIKDAGHFQCSLLWTLIQDHPNFGLNCISIRYHVKVYFYRVLREKLKEKNKMVQVKILGLLWAEELHKC